MPLPADWTIYPRTNPTLEELPNRWPCQSARFGRAYKHFGELPCTSTGFCVLWRSLLARGRFGAWLVEPRGISREFHCGATLDAARGRKSFPIESESVQTSGERVERLRPDLGREPRAGRAWRWQIRISCLGHTSIAGRAWRWQSLAPCRGKRRL